MTHWGPNSQFDCLKGATACSIPVFMKPKGFKLRRQSMLLEKCSKRGDLLTSQNSENGVPVQAGVQLTVIAVNVATKGDQKSISKGCQNRAL